MTSEKNKFNIRKCEGWLNQEQLKELLDKLPIDFYTIPQDADSRSAFYEHRLGEIEVYHGCGVVNFYPPAGKRLSCATLRDMDFPIRPDNIMDDAIGLRCCFHPKLSSFGIAVDKKHLAEVAGIELDIYKMPIDDKDVRYGSWRKGNE